MIITFKIKTKKFHENTYRIIHNRKTRESKRRVENKNNLTTSHINKQREIKVNGSANIMIVRLNTQSTDFEYLMFMARAFLSIHHRLISFVSADHRYSLFIKRIIIYITYIHREFGYIPAWFDQN